MATTGMTHLGEFGTKQAADLYEESHRPKLDMMASHLTSNILGIQEVCLFTSDTLYTHSRVGTIGLVIVSDVLHDMWMHWLRHAIDSAELDATMDDGYSHEEWEAIRRLSGFLAVVGRKLNDEWDSDSPIFGKRITPGELNIFVLPAGWKKPQGLEFLREIGSVFVPHLFAELLADAIEFNQATGTFWPSETH